MRRDGWHRCEAQAAEKGKHEQSISHVGTPLIQKFTLFGQTVFNAFPTSAGFIFSMEVNSTETMLNNWYKKTPLVQAFPWQVLSGGSAKSKPAVPLSSCPFLHNKLQLSLSENLKIHNRHRLHRVLPRAMSCVLLSNGDLLQTNPSTCWKFLVCWLCW